MLRDPLFKACTRPAMLFGAPMKPVLFLFGAALLVGVWVAFVSRAAAVVCVALAIPAWLAMRQVSAHDEHRLGQHLMRVGVVVLFVQIGALSPEAQHPCGFPRVATPAS